MNFKTEQYTVWTFYIFDGGYIGNNDWLLKEKFRLDITHQGLRCCVLSIFFPIQNDEINLASGAGTKSSKVGIRILDKVVPMSMRKLLVQWTVQWVSKPKMYSGLYSEHATSWWILDINNCWADAPLLWQIAITSWFRFRELQQMLMASYSIFHLFQSCRWDF